jgi:hypothetical protein
MAAERVPITRTHEPTYGTSLDVMPAVEHRPLVWSSIVGGFLIGLTTFAILNLLGLALGLPAFNAGRAAAEGTAPASQAGLNTTLWAGISSIISYLIGGFAAARIADLFPRARGAGNGVMVFLLSVPFAMFMASQGISGVLGGLGGIAGGVADLAAQQLPNLQGPASTTVSPPDVSRAAEGARNAAWGALIGTLLALGASALGGFAGARDRIQTVYEVDTRP